MRATACVCLLILGLGCTDLRAGDPEFLRGDADGDGRVLPLFDGVFLIAWSFVGGPAPPCFDAADANDDGELDGLRDGLFLLALDCGSDFAPPSPGPEKCGPDPTDDDLDCDVVPDPCPADELEPDSHYTVEISESAGAPGDEVIVSIVLTHDGDSVIGYEFGVCHDDLVSIEEQNIEQGPCVALFSEVSVTDDGWHASVLRLSGHTIETRMSIELYRATYTLGEMEGTAALTFCNGVCESDLSRNRLFLRVGVSADRVVLPEFLDASIEIDADYAPPPKPDPSPWTTPRHQKIDQTEGGFEGDLAQAQFGNAIAHLGDLDGTGDSVAAIAVGESEVDTIWILFLDAHGTVIDERSITEKDGSRFGDRLAAIGDLDGDGIPELAVGAPMDDDKGVTAGAVWILFLDDDGSVQSDVRITSDTAGIFFGDQLAALGDLDGDGKSVAALAVGSSSETTILFLDEDGAVVSEQVLDVTGVLAGVGDINGDGVADLAQGSDGSVTILFLNADGTVDSEQLISATEGGFEGGKLAFDAFGAALAGIGDLNRDGVPDLIVGAPADDDTEDGDTNDDDTCVQQLNRGAIWVLFLESDGTVTDQVKISDVQGGFTGELNDGSNFGTAMSSAGDLNGDGFTDLAVGATGDGPDGALWILFPEKIQEQFLRGDVNGNGTVDALTDAIQLLNYGFAGGEDPPCFDAADVNGNNDVDACTDALFLLRFGFTAGNAPPDPGPYTCGTDSEFDDVHCIEPPEVCR